MCRTLPNRFEPAIHTATKRGVASTTFADFADGAREKFGRPKAVWMLCVKDFPAVVTMDAHGRSLHQEVADTSKEQLQGVLTL